MGTRIDPLFGPLILLGGEGEAEAGDSATTVALPPLNAPLARALMHRSGVWSLLVRTASCRGPTTPRCSACWSGCRSC